ncbi:hypothetical protein AMJ48_00590 [Parcubacteria bacterium DG_74_1]|nr:MAG: hypothetical protein AMJ48_00590 [Parcubacteria bacterium DG_74_1]
MFYKCQKCKKVWQYPIEKCPECFSALEKIKSEKVKVIGVSRVTIPTMFHPKIPYFVLVLEDEKGNKWVWKSVEEYRIGEELKIETTTESNTVAVWRIKYDVLEGIEKVVELFDGIDVRQDFKILILPTLVLPRHPHFAENTSPQFLESLIKYLMGRGVRLENIKVAGQSFDETPIEAAAQKSQLLKVCQNYRILPLDLAKTDFIKKGEGDFSFEISEEVFKADLIANLPILKIGKASASENILKFLKKENYLGLKYLHSEEQIIENLNKVLPRYFTLAEAQSIQKTDQFVAHLNLIFGSFNPLNLDRIFAEVTMTRELPEYLKRVKIDDIPIVGRKIKEVQYEVEKY